MLSFLISALVVYFVLVVPVTRLIQLFERNQAALACAPGSPASAAACRSDWRLAKGPPIHDLLRLFPLLRGVPSGRTSKQDMSSSRRGGLRSHSGPGGPTYEQLYSQARRRNIKGRSSMNKAQLTRELGR